MNNDKVINGMFNDSTKDLFSDVGSVIYLRFDEIEANPLNQAPINDIEELKENIRDNGISLPLVAYEIDKSNKFRLMGGERRWTAASELRLKEIPVMIIDKPENEWEEILGIENLNSQREDDLEARIKRYESVWEMMPKEKRPEGRKRDWISVQLGRKIGGRQVDNYLNDRVNKESQEIKKLKKEVTPFEKIFKAVATFNKVLDNYDDFTDLVSYRDDGELEDILTNIDNTKALLQELDLYISSELKHRKKLK